MHRTVEQLRRPTPPLVRPARRPADGTNYEAGARGDRTRRGRCDDGRIVEMSMAGCRAKPPTFRSGLGRRVGGTGGHRPRPALSVVLPRASGRCWQGYGSPIFVESLSNLAFPGGRKPLRYTAPPGQPFPIAPRAGGQRWPCRRVSGRREACPQGATRRAAFGSSPGRQHVWQPFFAP